MKPTRRFWIILAIVIIVVAGLVILPEFIPGSASWYPFRLGFPNQLGRGQQSVDEAENSRDFEMKTESDDGRMDHSALTSDASGSSQVLPSDTVSVLPDPSKAGASAAAPKVSEPTTPALPDTPASGRRPSAKPVDRKKLAQADLAKQDDHHRDAASEPSLPLEVTEKTKDKLPGLPVPRLDAGLRKDDSLTTVYERAVPFVVSVETIYQSADRTSQRSTTASGIIYSEDGYIVTNYTNLALALDSSRQLEAGASIRVYVHGESRVFPARFVNGNVDIDLALLKIDPGSAKLVAATFSESPVKIGQEVICLGFPVFLFAEGSISRGSVTGIQHAQVLENGLSFYLIQTDAVVSQASSGGALLDAEGHVVGITNGNVSRSYLDTMGYALPAETLHNVVRYFLEPPTDTAKAWLGVTVLNDESYRMLSKRHGLPGGLYVTNINRSSAAYTYGLNVGDVLLKINDKELTDHDVFVELMKGFRPGRGIELEVFCPSDHTKKTIRVYLTSSP